MGKEKISSIIVAIVVSIIISMPIAHAISLNGLTTSGSDNLQGIRKNYDYTTASVTVNGELNVSDLMTFLRFNVPGVAQAPPIECTGTGPYTCNYQSGTLQVPSGIYPVSVSYPGALPLNTEIIVDGEGPSIIAPQVYQEGTSVRVTYRLLDPEYSGTNTGTCSGIDKVEIYVNGGIDTTTYASGSNSTTNGTNKICNYEGSDILNLNTDGNHQVYLKSYDVLGNTKNSPTMMIETDFTPPVIVGGYQIQNLNGETLRYLNTKNPIYGATIIVKILEETSLSAVDGDLSGLRPGAHTNEQIYPPTGPQNKCTYNSINKTHTCEFHGIDIHIETNNPTITLTVKDTKGLETTTTLAGNFEVDSTNATVKSLNTNKTFGGISYLTEGENRFIAVVHDEGAGFVNEKVGGGKGFIFDLSEITGEGQVPAENCTSTGSEWNCYIDQTLTGLNNGERMKIMVSPTSQDDAGNTVEVPTTLNGTVVVDIVAPIMYENVTITESLTGRTEWIQAGDSIDITMKIIEDESVILTENALLDISEILSENITEIEAEECEITGQTNQTNQTNQTIYSCIWHVENITTTAIGEYDTITFTIKDIVGNELEVKKKDIEILTTSTEENPNYLVYKSGTSCDLESTDQNCMTPPKIDKRAITITDYGVWIPIYIGEYLPTPTGDFPTPLSVELIGCEQKDNGTDLKSAEVYGEMIDLKRFSLYTVLKKGVYTSNNISIECNMEIYSKYGGYIANKENETFDITIKMFSSTYKPLGDAFIKKLKDETMFMDDWLSYIDQMKDLIEGLRNLCGLGITLTNLKGILAGIDGVILGFATTMYAFSSSSADALWRGWRNNVYCPLSEGKIGGYIFGDRSIINDVIGGGDVASLGGGIFADACAYLGCGKGCWFGNENATEIQKDVQEFLDFSETEWVKDINSFAENVTLPSLPIGSSNDLCNDNATGNVNETSTFTLAEAGFPTLSGSQITPENNLLMAIGCMCIPAIIDHLSEYREIECDYLKCMFDMSVVGAPLSECEEDKGVAMCKKTFGPFIDLIPDPMKFISDIAEWAHNIIMNAPTAMVKALKDKACEPYYQVIQNTGGGEESCTSTSLMTDIGTGKGIIVSLCGFAEASWKYADLMASLGATQTDPNNPFAWDMDGASLGDFFRFDELSFGRAEESACEDEEVEKLIEEINS